MSGLSPDGPKRVTFLIPTLNAARHLPRCLLSIRKQLLSQDDVEVIVVDGGSDDGTTEIASSFGAQVVTNPLRSTESARALGIYAATGDVVAFLDADNELIGDDWTKRMLVPFEDERVVACEPLYWDTESSALSIIDSYCALLGMTDPLNLFMGNYSHHSYLTGRWTDLPIDWIEKEGYLEIQPPSGAPSVLPTLGSNGCMFRRSTLLERHEGDYLFHLDFCQRLWEDPTVRLARVPVAVAHYYANSLRSFAGKARLKVQDYYFYRATGDRSYPYASLGRRGVVKFALYSFLVVPAMLQALRGFFHRPNRAWVLHPVCCLVVALAYGAETIRLLIHKGETRPFERDKVRW